MNLMIPVARVSVRGGGGGGTGDMPDKQGGGKGTGMGIGMNVVSAPVGFIKQSADGWVYEPIIDRNKVVTAAAVVSGLALVVLRTGMKMFKRRGFKPARA
jgi:hypothetical protein